MRDVELVECKACGISCRFFVGDFQPRPKRDDGWKRMLKKNKVGDEKKAVEVEVEAEAEALPAVFEFKTNLHCEDCATKVRNMVREFPGVEEVKEEGGTEKLTVVIRRADPELLREWLEKKAKRKVDLVPVSAAPPPAAEETDGGNKPGKEATVALKTRLDCEACVQKCRRIVLSLQGVQDVSIQKLHGVTHVITVRGTMDADRLPGRLRSKLNRHVEVVTPPPTPPSSPRADKDSHGHGSAGEAKEEGKADGGKAAKKKAGAAEPSRDGGGGNHGDVEKNDRGMEGYLAQPYVVPVYPPQVFSDDNPNSCSIM